MQLKFPIVLFLFFGITIALQAEDTYARVYAIMQTHCTNGCHTAATPSGMLVLNADANTVYNNLVGANPTNPAAANKGYKRVEPGYADRSFLFKKISNGLEHNFDLEAAEGNVMPPYGALQLTTVEKELVRQWILFGAPQTGEVVSEPLIEEFYAAGGTMITPPPPPPQGEGFQVHHGPIFLQPGQEIEAFRKYDLRLPDSLDVVGFDILMNQESHHFVVYQYNPTLTTDIPVGVRMSTGFADELIMYQNATFLDIWQFNEPHILPQNTAFRWGPNTAIDLNYHIKNYSAVSVLPAEAYINFYTQPKNPNRKEMKFGIAPYGGSNPFVLNVPNNAQETTLSFTHATTEDNWVKIWKLQGHTHKLGRDFDVYFRNEDGTQGSQLYEGFYNETYEFNQGYYDYAHPPVLKLEPSMCLNLREGLIVQAKFFNDGPEPVGFGFTTNDEMFVVYYNYVDIAPDEVFECITNIDNTHSESFVGYWNIAPNPSTGKFNINLEFAEPTNTKIELYEMTGRKAANLFEGNLQQGKHALPIEQNLPTGVYLLSIITPKGTDTQQVIIGNNDR